MTGRHRGGRLRAGPLIVALVLIAGLAVAIAYRRELLSLVGLGSDAGAQVTIPSPEPSPSAAPSVEPSPTPPPKERITIHGTGDVNLDPSYIPNFRTHGYRYAWTGLKGIFKDDDLTVINLECAVSNLGTAVPKEFNFRGDPKALPVAERFGVDVANLGNNHAGDFGKEALIDTRKNVLEAGMQPVGAGKDHRQATKPARFEIGGWRVAVLGFGGVVPEPGWIAGPGNPGMADGDDISKMVRAVKRAKAGADIVIVSIHWGVELDTTPRPDDEERAEAMIDAGADAIFGHHSHRLNPMGRYKGRPIFWGLGNFVWPAHSAAGATTAVARVTVDPDGRVRGKLLPAYIEDSGHPVLRAKP